jgi:hypothetical protein
MESAVPAMDATVREMAHLMEGIGAESEDAAERLDDAADQLAVLADAYEQELRRVDRGMSQLIAHVETDPDKLEPVGELAHAIHGLAMAAEHGLGQGAAVARSLEMAGSGNPELRARTSRSCDALLRVAPTWRVIRRWSDRLRAVEASSPADS